MKYPHIVIMGLLLQAVSGPLPAAAQTVGLARGALVAVGGNLRDPAILQRFVDLAGGPDASIVVIPTAGEDPTYDQSWLGLRQFRDVDARQLTVLHTRDRAVAGSEAFVQPIRQARGVFFTGGRQWKLADAYLGTRTQRELEALLARGGVIGGTSAGATILGSFLVRGDTSGPELMIGDHTEGLALLKNTAVDQHLLPRNRQFDLIPVIERYPHLLGIGLDEDTAIVVQGDRFEVIGRGYVAIYDSHRIVPPDGRFYFLAPGDQFDLVKREASRSEVSRRPLDRVTATEWKKPSRER